MIPEEAKQRIEHQEVLEQENKLDSLALDMAANALEKQIASVPKKIRRLDYDGAIGYCPTCDYGVNIRMNYCDNCGQRLDWEGVKG